MNSLIIKPDLDGMFDQLERSFYNSFNRPGLKNLVSKSGYPKLNILENNDSVDIEATVPGLSREEINIDVDDDCITISSESNDSRDRKEKYALREIHKSSFKRSVYFDVSRFKLDKIEAKLENGLLKITVPKSDPEPEPIKKRIDIR